MSNPFKSPDTFTPPPPPPPQNTIQQQTASNATTGITNQELNAPNQSTPFGTLSTVQDGTWSDGTPKFRITQSLSPEVQSVYDTYLKNQGAAGGLVSTAINNAGTALDKPFNLDTEAERRIIDLGTRRLDPIWGANEAATRARLANEGFTDEGSTGAKNAWDTFNRARNDAYDQLMLTGYGTAENNALAERNLPFQTLASIFGYGTPSVTPSWVNGPNTNVAPTNVAGITQTGYENTYNPAALNYQTNEASRQATLGGLASILGATAGGAARGYFSNPTPVNNMVKGWFS